VRRPAVELNAGDGGDTRDMRGGCLPVEIDAGVGKGAAVELDARIGGHHWVISK